MTAPFDRNGKRATTIAELGRIAGVSGATVSRALAGNPKISEATRARITELARAHGYQINTMARNLRLKRSGAIGVLMPLGHDKGQHLTDPFFMTMIAYLADEIAERGYDLLLSRVIPSDDGWLDREIVSGRVDGVIVIGQSDQSAVLDRVASSYAPLAVWGAAQPGHVHLTVGSDNFEGGRIAARRLLGRGCRRLAFFGNTQALEFAQRQAGFFSELGEAERAVASTLSAPLTAESSYDEVQQYLETHSVPDGIFAASDVIAMSAIRAITDAGYDVPDDVAVIGYDDVSFAAHTTPPLTTVRQDLKAGAIALCDALFARMNGDSTAPIMLKPELVVRGSA